jgi:hypothetical protein
LETFQRLLQEHGALSSFRPGAATLAVILALDLALTLVHSAQELRGHLWRYFGAIAGARIPDVLGFLSFFVALTLGLWAVGLVGIAGYLPVVDKVPDALAMAAVGGLIGARLSDSWYSHIRLHRRGYRPNPGLTSTPFYIAEAVVLAMLFAAGLWRYWWAAALGLLAGWGSFAVVLPGIRILRDHGWFWVRQQDRWLPGEPIPPSAT